MRTTRTRVDHALRVDPHPLAAVTGSPILHKGRLYIPLASREEAAGGGPDYPCCTFRGSVVALDADTGRQVWKTHIISEEPKATKKNSRGVQLYAPSGAGIWDTPTIDEARGLAIFDVADCKYQGPGPYNERVLALHINGAVVGDIVFKIPPLRIGHSAEAYVSRDHCDAGILRRRLGRRSPAL